MIFKLDATFEADNLDDAFYKLSKHFLQLLADTDEYTFDEVGTHFDLKPLEEGADNDSME